MSGLYPGSAGALSDHARLVEEKEWAVLAALALRAGEAEALGALASAAGDWRAFAWMWSVLDPSNPHHLYQLSERLTAGVAVPKNRRDAVEGFVLAPDPLQAMNPGAYQAHLNQPNSGPMLRRAAQESVLARLNPNSDLARRLARAVLDAEEGRHWPALHHAAFDVLGASRRKADRGEVLERASALAPRERLRPLLGLAPLRCKGEEEELVGHLGEALPVAGPFDPGGPTGEDYWASARLLVARLSASGVGAVLGRPWARHEPDRERLLGGDFVARLGAEKLIALLGSDLEGDVRRHLIRAASARLPLEELANLGRWTHGNLDPEWSRPLRNRLHSDARPPQYGASSPHRGLALEALRDFALAADDPDTAAHFAACLAPGEAPDVVGGALASGPPPERVGAVAGALLAQDAAAPEGFPAAPEGHRNDVAEMLDLYTADEERAAFVAGMLHQAGNAGGKRDGTDLSFLGPRLLGRPLSTRVFAEAGRGHDLVPAAHAAEDRREAFLGIAEAAVEHLGDDALEAVLLNCGWNELDGDRYARFVAALRRRPDALLGEAAGALASLPGPDADAVPAGHLRAVLAAALDAAAGDLARVAGDRHGEHLRDLLDQSDAGLRRLALRWALALEPGEETLALLIARRASTRGLDDEFAGVLAAYADHLARRARDASLDSGERARALDLAREADPRLAREAAFGVAGTARQGELRRAAASVLATTEARPEDEARLGRLLDGEGDRQTRRGLAAALRNISSGTVARALANLRSLVGLDPEPDADARAFVPHEDWDARFVEWVDRVRRTRSDDPAAFVAALINLSDLLVDLAAAELQYADPDGAPLGRRGGQQAADLRANARARPDTGELLRRPPLTELFPWFRQAAILREKRAAHPAPLGSTEPVRIGHAEADYARELFRDVVAGWEGSMRETAGLAERGTRG